MKNLNGEWPVRKGIQVLSERQRGGFDYAV